MRDNQLSVNNGIFDWVAQTFREQATVAIYQVFAQEPAVSELIVPLDQFDAVVLCKAQFVRTAGNEVVWWMVCQ
jgi:hypothetical protein